MKCDCNNCLIFDQLKSLVNWSLTNNDCWKCRNQSATKHVGCIWGHSSEGMRVRFEWVSPALLWWVQGVWASCHWCSAEAGFDTAVRAAWPLPSCSASNIPAPSGLSPCSLHRLEQHTQHTQSDTHRVTHTERHTQSGTHRDTQSDTHKQSLIKFWFIAK